MVRFVISSPMILGMICRMTIWKLETPSTRAAATKSCSLMRYTSPLVKRQVPVQPTATMATISENTPLPSTSITRIATISCGMP